MQDFIFFLRISKNSHKIPHPAQIELFFSEAVVPGFSTIRVLDDQGNQVDNDDARVDPLDSTRLTVSVRSLGDGVYTVSWKALSAVLCSVSSLPLD